MPEGLPNAQTPPDVGAYKAECRARRKECFVCPTGLPTAQTPPDVGAYKDALVGHDVRSASRARRACQPPKRLLTSAPTNRNCRARRKECFACPRACQPPQTPPDVGAYKTEL